MGTLDPETIGLFVGAIITLMIFSYLLTDNVLFRWALALLVGGGIGYALGMAWRFVLLDWITKALKSESIPEKVVYAVPLALGVLLLLKGFTTSKLLGRLAVLGNVAMGYLVGVGTAVALSGALMGTLIPQVTETGTAVTLDKGLPGLLQGIIMLIGTIASLLVFSPHRHEKEGRVRPTMTWIQRVGKFFIILALAVAFSGALTSALSALVMRIWQIAELAFSFRGG